MHELWNTITSWLADERIASATRAVAIVVFGLLIGRMASRGLVRFLQRKLDRQQTMVLRRAIFYPIATITVLSAVRELGINLSVLLGAAGVLTVALGFASQTSASNLISGIFLIGERSFVVGDIIEVGQTTGEVLSIDLLSVKLRTFQNLLVRVPNETLIKSEITNLSRFPIRRIDLDLRIGYGEDLDRVHALLMEVAIALPGCLTEPEPVFFVQEFGENALLLRFGVWVPTARWTSIRTELQTEVRRALDAGGVEVPRPRRSLESRQDAPVLVRLVDEVQR